MTHTGFSTGPAPHEPAEERVFLHNVQWQTYERLLADLANQSSIRLSYNQGTLEIMTPLADMRWLTEGWTCLSRFWPQNY